MKKQCIILFDCHGMQIFKNLKNYKNFIDLYDVVYVPIYEYSEKDFTDEIKDKLKKCDLIIYQKIKNDRKFIHHDIIKGYLKEDNIQIILPHYVFSGYFINYDLSEDFNLKNNYSSLLNIWQNITINEDLIKNNLENSLKEIEDLEKNCIIKMSDFVRENYSKYRLFYNRGYPTYLFFNELTKRILNYLNFDISNYEILYTKFGINKWVPILPCVQKTLNLNFDCFTLKYTKNEIFDAIVYLITYKELKEKDLDLFKKDNFNKLKYFKNLINY